MIRKHKLKQRIPRKLIAQFKEAHSHQFARSLRYDSWCQVSIECNNLRKWCMRQIGQPEEAHEAHSIIFHTIYGDIERHSDEQSRSCKLIPIRKGKLTSFHVDGCSRDYETNFPSGYYISFNDCNEHYLLNEENCRFEAISID